jgi:hypothetical protein
MMQRDNFTILRVQKGGRVIRAADRGVAGALTRCTHSFSFRFTLAQICTVRQAEVVFNDTTGERNYFAGAKRGVSDSSG